MSESLWIRWGERLGAFIGPRLLHSNWLKSRFERLGHSASMVSIHYADLGRRLFEAIRLSRTANRCILSTQAKILFSHLQERSEGVLILSAHFGHWEAMGLALHRMGYRFSAVSTLGKTDLLNRLLQHVRAYFGLHVLSRMNCARQLVNQLQNGHHIALFIDVPSTLKPTELTFHGEMVSRSNAANRLARLTKASCIFVFNQRTKTGMYQIHAERVPEEAEPLQWCHARLEDLVRAAPSQWVWLLDKPRS